MNKFPIIAEHFILATFKDAPQSYLLDEEDIWMIYCCITEWERHGKGKLFAFYNSGPDSGASQPHRHIQFLPADSMREGVPEGSWNLPSDDGKRILDLPLAVTMTSLHEKKSWNSRTLYQEYRELMEAKEQVNDEPLDGRTLSYNLAMTSTDMLVCPRVRESVTIKDDEGKELGSLSPNGTLLGGTLMVKSREAFDFLRTNTAPQQQGPGHPLVHTNSDGKWVKLSCPCEDRGHQCEDYNAFVAHCRDVHSDGGKDTKWVFDILRTEQTADSCGDANAVKEGDLPSTTTATYSALDQILAAVGHVVTHYEGLNPRNYLKL